MGSQSQENDGVSTGQQRPQSTWGQANNMAFAVMQMLGKLQTATLVQIKAVYNTGGVSPVGLVDVVPMVHQIDGDGVAQPHTTIYNVPYFRLQGGGDAVILDPKVGDIGVAVFASRDLTKVKHTKAPAVPGSLRQYSFADALYIGGVLNGTPTQYVQFSTAGIKLHSPTAVILDAPDVQISAATVEINATASVTMTTPTFTLNGAFVQAGGGASTFSGPVTNNGVNIGSTHKHGGVTTGSGVSSTPQ